MNTLKALAGLALTIVIFCVFIFGAWIGGWAGIAVFVLCFISDLRIEKQHAIELRAAYNQGRLDAVEPNFELGKQEGYELGFREAQQWNG